MAKLKIKKESKKKNKKISVKRDEPAVRLLKQMLDLQKKQLKTTQQLIVTNAKIQKELSRPVKPLRSEEEFQEKLLDAQGQLLKGQEKMLQGQQTSLERQQEALHSQEVALENQTKAVATQKRSLKWINFGFFAFLTFVALWLFLQLN